VRIRNSQLARRAAAVGTAVALAGGVGLATATPAAAAPKDGVCNAGQELCLYWANNWQGPVFDLWLSEGDFREEVFPGTFTTADNNTQSVWNRDTTTWYVYTGYYRGGVRGSISPGQSGNFTAMFSDAVSSAYWYL
jgi:hypothetical protein